MVIATGKVLKIKLSEVLSSEMMDNFNKMKSRTCTKFYSQGGALTLRINDRNENSG